VLDIPVPQVVLNAGATRNAICDTVGGHEFFGSAAGGLSGGTSSTQQVPRQYWMVQQLSPTGIASTTYLWGEMD
jgi:hypothetical protein